MKQLILVALLLGFLPAHAEIKTEASIHEVPPILLEVIKCESGMRQKDAKGYTLRSHTNDLGLFQINEFYHGERAKELGFDLHTGRGNLAYGLLLYEEEGLKPWSASKPCWKKKIAML